MPDDLVTRLREARDLIRKQGATIYDGDTKSLYGEAADRIEALEALREAMEIEEEESKNVIAARRRHIEELQVRIEALEAENAALREDAEKWRKSQMPPPMGYAGISACGCWSRGTYGGEHYEHKCPTHSTPPGGSNDADAGEKD